MGLITKILRWILKGLTLFSSVAPSLWGITVYSGIAFSLYIIVTHTGNLVSEFNTVFSGWANGLDVTLVKLFQDQNNSSSLFQFSCYVLALDVPIEWFRDFATGFLRYFLTYTIGTLLAVVEISIMILGIYWVRKRLKSMSMGLGNYKSSMED